MGGMLQTGQTIDDIYNGSLPLLGLNVEIDVLEHGATSVDSICPDDIFLWRYEENNETSGICTYRITRLNKYYRDIWDPLVLPVYLCDDQSGVEKRRLFSIVGTSEKGKGKE